MNRKTVKIPAGANAYLPEKEKAEYTEIAIAQESASGWEEVLRMKHTLKEDRIEVFQITQDESGDIRLQIERTASNND